MDLNNNLEKLKENEEKILSFLKAKDEYFEEVESTISELSLALGTTTASTVQYVKNLIERRYLITKKKRQYNMYIITQAGRYYLEQYNVQPYSLEIFNQMISEQKLAIKDDLQDSQKLKNEVENIRNEVENIRNELKKSEESINSKIENFYGRIGEILTLIITAIAMIVFNIQLIGAVKIDFNEPVKAFKIIMAIDLPYIILFIVCISIFHFIIGKDYIKDDIKLKDVALNIFYKTIPLGIIIILCYIIIVL